MIQIRPFNPTDAEYEAILRLRNTIQPDNPSTVAIWRHWDDQRNPDEIFRRFVVEADSWLLAYGHVGETATRDGTFFIEAHIHPNHQGGGLTRQLYDHLLTAVLSHQPRRILTQIRENETMKLHWLSQNGFRQGNRYPVSHLDVARFDLAPFTAVLDKVTTQGIEIISLPDLMPRQPDWQQQVYELDYALMRDVPAAELYEKRPFPQFVREEFEHPNFLPGGWFLALDGERFVGMTALIMRGQSTQRMATALTGVLPPYRQRGIATALKLQSIHFAQSLGTEIIETSNEAHNPMYQINRQLGFKPQPAWLDFIKKI